MTVKILEKEIPDFCFKPFLLLTSSLTWTLSSKNGKCSIKKAYGKTMKWNISWLKKIVSVSISIKSWNFWNHPDIPGQRQRIILLEYILLCQVMFTICFLLAGWGDKKKECNSVTLFGVIVIVFLWVYAFYRNLEQTS